MHPILFTLGSYDIRAYTVFTVLALLIVAIGIYYAATLNGFSKKQLLISLIAMAASAFVGARLLHILTNISLYQDQPWRLYSLDFIGFAIFGGIIGACLAALICSRLFKFNLWRLGDLAAPWLGLGIV